MIEPAVHGNNCEIALWKPTVSEICKTYGKWYEAELVEENKKTVSDSEWFDPWFPGAELYGGVLLQVRRFLPSER